MEKFEPGFNQLDPTKNNERTGEATIDMNGDHTKELENDFYGEIPEINQYLMAKNMKPMAKEEEERALEIYKELHRGGNMVTPENTAKYIAEKLMEKN